MVGYLVSWWSQLNILTIIQPIEQLSIITGVCLINVFTFPLLFVNNDPILITMKTKYNSFDELEIKMCWRHSKLAQLVYPIASISSPQDWDAKALFCFNYLLFLVHSRSIASPHQCLDFPGARLWTAVQGGSLLEDTKPCKVINHHRTKLLIAI